MYDEHTLRKIVENKFKGKIHPEIGNCKESPTGERYWTVCSDGIYTEGCKNPIYHNAAHEAFNEYKLNILSAIDATNKYGTGNEVLYWRKLPCVKREKNKFRIYSRFLISSKPVIQSADYNERKKHD